MRPPPDGATDCEAAPVQFTHNGCIADATGTFVDPTGRTIGITVPDTRGCSGAQIIQAADLGAGQVRSGITRSALLDWIATG